MTIEGHTLPSAGTFESRSSFNLGEHPWLWMPRSGTLQVFAVKQVYGTEAGALHPLFDVHVGQAVFGIADADHLRIALVAKRSPDSEVVALPLAAVRENGALGGTVDGATLLAEWCASLSRAAAGDLMPKGVEWLPPGARLAVKDERRLLSSAAPLLWVRQTAGSSRVLGRPDMRITPGTAAYPLSSMAWIELQPNGALMMVDGFGTLDDDVFWKSLAAFHTDALTCVAWRLEEAAARERQRFRARSVADIRGVQAALRDLASPLTRDEDRAAAGAAEALDDPLLRACTMIGRTLDVSIVPHPDMVHGRPVPDPVAAIAQASGIRHRRVALKDRWSTRSSEPLLVFRDADQRPAALIPRRARGYAIFDPERGTVAPLDAATAATLHPFAVMFYRAFPRTPLSAWDLLAFGFKGSRRDVVMIIAMSAAAGLLAILLPYVTGIVFDSVIPNAQRSQLVTVAALLVVAAVVMALFNLARGFAVLRLRGRLTLALEGALWDRLLSLPLPFFRQYAAGDLAQRSADFSEMRDIISGSLLGAVLSGIFSVFSFGLLFYYSPRLAVAATLMTLVALVVTLVAGMLQVRLQRRISAAMGRIAGMVVEFIGAIAKFRIAGAERRAFVLWVKEFAGQKRTDFNARRISTLMAVFNSVYVVACIAVLFFVHSAQVTPEGTLSTGQFLAFIAAFGQFMAAALAMGGALIGMASVVPLYERASPILRALPEVLPAQTSPGELRGEIEAHHLVFQYHPDAPLVLRDVSFHIRPGEYVAFVGPSGCGKSTLFRALLGFEKPVSGSVHYDGVDLAGLDVRAVRRQIGVVLQGGTLIAGSIAANIGGSASVPMEEAWEAARLAGLEEDIRNMPMGMHTIVQSGGGGLSGGQRQRILIARAVVAKPRMLLFDEATSALDNRTQAIVSESLESLKATRVVIAHRLSTILGADRIFVMDQGRIVQAGTYTELMREPGVFRELAERQLA